MGKGDKPRPLSISYEEYANRYDAIYGKKDNKDKESLLNLTEEEEIEAEKRINIIGQNGNDGLHYDEVDGES
jgi:hypothetical protein